jgi:hypothetical protein
MSLPQAEHYDVNTWSAGNPCNNSHVRAVRRSYACLLSLLPYVISLFDSSGLMEMMLEYNGVYSIKPRF